MEDATHEPTPAEGASIMRALWEGQSQAVGVETKENLRRVDALNGGGFDPQQIAALMAATHDPPTAALLARLERSFRQYADSLRDFRAALIRASTQKPIQGNNNFSITGE